MLARTSSGCGPIGLSFDAVSRSSKAPDGRDGHVLAALSTARAASQGESSPSAIATAATPASPHPSGPPTSGAVSAREAAGRGSRLTARPSRANAPRPSAGNSQNQSTEECAAQ